jgi:hypothetical protein
LQRDFSTFQHDSRGTVTAHRIQSDCDAVAHVARPRRRRFPVRSPRAAPRSPGAHRNTRKTGTDGAGASVRHNSGTHRMRQASARGASVACYDATARFSFSERPWSACFHEKRRKKRRVISPKTEGGATAMHPPRDAAKFQD